MMVRGAQHVEPSTHAALVEAAWSTGVLPLQRHALRLLGAPPRDSRQLSVESSVVIEDREAEGMTHLRVPEALPHVTMLVVLRLMRTIRERVVASGAAPVGTPRAGAAAEGGAEGGLGDGGAVAPLVLRPVVSMSVAVQVSLCMWDYGGGDLGRGARGI